MAAVRETHEEIGIPPESIIIIAALEPVFVYRSNNLMFPFVAMLTDDSLGMSNEGEVDSTFVVKLSDIREGLGTYSNIAYRWKPVNVPGFRVSEGVIWGATAMVLSQLLSILDDFTG
jgi:8-oxo-dGTP pyrophosphatase MutT (NUDIX family)